MAISVLFCNGVLVLAVTVLFIREWNRRRALELLIARSINQWRNLDEVELDSRDDNPDIHNDNRL